MIVIAPVMVSIHGGGFTFGDKNLFGRPTGLFNASGFADGQESLDDSEGIIYVSIFRSSKLSRV